MEELPTPKQVVKAYLLNKPKKVYTRISPSNLGKCMRAHYYKLQHIPELIEPGIGALANFEVGFLWEELIKRALEDQNVPFSYQDHFDDIELNMAGSSDFIIGDKHVHSIMWDSKTMNSMWFNYREQKKKKGQYDWWAENYLYIVQQGAYLLMAERAGWKVEKSILAFISKDNGYIGDELEVHLTSKLRKEVEGRVKKLNHYLTRCIVPPCECDGWEIDYCSWGRQSTMEPNAKKRMCATECCPPDPETIEVWRNEENLLH